MRVMYLVAPTIESGVEDALGRGWVQIARARFVTGENVDVRVVTRFSHMVPFAGPETRMVKAAGYESGGDLLPCYQDRWLEDMAQFEEFVRVGNGVWVGEEKGEEPAGAVEADPVLGKKAKRA